VEFHRGRLVDHVHLRVRDLEWSRRFYQAALGAIGLEVQSGEGYFFAFAAEDEETVKRFHAAAIAAGGKDNGAPGERDYHPGYYGAYVLDPDGNNIEAVYHGPARRSAPSVVITPL
jgi:catechol 2,3-dioxygenase-like lactoylglutathione lyase family enzyme